MDGAARLPLPGGSADQADRRLRPIVWPVVDTGQEPHRRRGAESATQHAPVDHPGGGHAAQDRRAAARRAAGDGAAQRRSHRPPAARPRGERFSRGEAAGGERRDRLPRRQDLNGRLPVAVGRGARGRQAVVQRLFEHPRAGVFGDPLRHDPGAVSGRDHGRRAGQHPDSRSA